MTDEAQNDEPLKEFFDGRTIGCKSYGWTWRGSEYDSGWDDVTEEELETLRRLLNERKYPKLVEAKPPEGWVGGEFQLPPPPPKP